jgi:orotate phosphoribosyltransferase
MQKPAESAVKIADYLLQIKAIKINPVDCFTWSSGWKSPIYCDNRLSLSHPEVRSFIKKELAQQIREHHPEAAALCGVATAGVAIGALAADELELPYAYCRPKPKAHGMKNQLEGSIDKDHKVVVVEDLISTGGSSLKVVEYLRNEGYDVVGMASIFTYGFPLAEENFEKANCPWFSLSNYSILIEEALKSGYVQAHQVESLKSWRENPGEWKG